MKIKKYTIDALKSSLLISLIIILIFCFITKLNAQDSFEPYLGDPEEPTNVVEPTATDSPSPTSSTCNMCGALNIGDVVCAGQIYAICQFFPLPAPGFCQIGGTQNCPSGQVCNGANPPPTMPPCVAASTSPSPSPIASPSPSSSCMCSNGMNPGETKCTGNTLVTCSSNCTISGMGCNPKTCKSSPPPAHCE